MVTKCKSVSLGDIEEAVKNDFSPEVCKAYEDWTELKSLGISI